MCNISRNDDIFFNWEWYFIPCILLCGIALVCVWKKKNRKSFEILMIHLFIQNIFFLLTLTYGCTDGKIFLILSILNKCFFVTQSSTISIINLQRLMLVRFPIKGSLWITKKRTIVALCAAYAFWFLSRAILPALENKGRYSDVVKILITYLFISAYYGTAIVIVVSTVLIIVIVCRRQRGYLKDSRPCKSNKSRTINLLVLMSVSYIISYIAPFFTFDNDKSAAGIYTHMLWVDSFVNSVSYIWLKTSVSFHLKKWIYSNCHKNSPGNTETYNETEI